jgi:hypothetical protein
LLFDGLGEDLFGGLRPDERLRVLVVTVDEVFDGGDEFGDVVVGAVADLLGGEDRELDLDHVHPGGTGWGEVEVDAFVAFEPADCTSRGDQLGFRTL